MSKLLPVYVAPDLCGPCGGKCCKRAPGITSPDDWGAPDRAVMATRIEVALRSDKWAIDWWEETSELVETEYVRPAIAGMEGWHRHGSYGGRCTMLGVNGCGLVHDARPLGCRAVIPTQGPLPHERHCGIDEAVGENQQQIARWTEYQDVLASVKVAMGDDFLGMYESDERPFHGWRLHR